LRPRRLPGLTGGGVQNLPRAVGLLIVEGGVVDEEICVRIIPAASGRC